MNFVGHAWPDPDPRFALGAMLRSSLHSRRRFSRYAFSRAVPRLSSMARS